MSRSLRTLVVDDSEDDALLLLRHLRQYGFEPDSQRVDTAEALHSAVTTSQWDAILCDAIMPRLDALTAVEVVRSLGMDVPFIVVSGTVGEEQLVELMKAGAHDIIVKDRLSRLGPAIERELEEAAVRRARVRADEQLRIAIESTSEGFVLYDSDDRLVICNETFRNFYDRIRELAVPGTRFEDVIRAWAERGRNMEAQGRVEEWVAERMARHRACREPFERQLADGRWVLVSERRTLDGGTVGIHSDITALKRAERAVRQNEAFLRLIADNLPTLIAYFDPEHRYRFINRTGAAWLARRPEDMIGRTIEEVLGRAAFDVFRPYYERARKGVEQRFEATAIYPDGVTRDVHVTYVPDRAEDGAVRGLVATVVDISAQKKAERDLRASEQRFRGAFEMAPHGIALVGTGGAWLKVNRAVIEMLGYGEAELLSTDVQSVTRPDEREDDLALIRKVLEGESPGYQRERRYIRRDGHTVSALLSVSLVRDTDGAPLHFVVQLLDLTERKHTEEQLRQAQKMEAVGQLTGGVAHDFNNLLTVIMGNARLLERALEGDERLLPKAGAISRAATRGADLTRRLLAFSRKQALHAEVVDLGEVVENMLGLLQRTLGEAISIKTSFAPGPHRVLVDPNELEHAVLNLVVNARDAMPDGGTLHFEIDGLVSDEADPYSAETGAPGVYVVLTVSDTGSGIPEDHLAHIFEPFFTTKEIGKGTGLGLSMVYGFAKQSGGWVAVDSALGRGTSFRLHLPQAEGTADEPGRAEDFRDTGLSGRGTILVVEDEPEVRNLAVTLLEEHGYRIIQAQDGLQALAILKDQPNIDLLFTDVVMPGGMSGRDLAARAVRLHPGLKVLLTSGHSDQQAALNGTRENGAEFIRKPYDDGDVLRKIKAILAA